MTPSSVNDYRLGITPIMMKCVEGLVKDHISRLPSAFDQYQFAYCPNRSTEDAITSALHRSLEHLERKNARVDAVKFADDTTLVCLSNNNNDQAYREEVKHLVNWCESNNLILNISKTKEIIVDFRKNQASHTPLTISSSAVVIVSITRFLGVQITDFLTWSKYIGTLVKRVQQCIFCFLLPSSPHSTGEL